MRDIPATTRPISPRGEMKFVPADCPLKRDDCGICSYSGRVKGLPVTMRAGQDYKIKVVCNYEYDGGGG